MKTLRERDGEERDVAQKKKIVIMVGQGMGGEFDLYDEVIPTQNCYNCICECFSCPSPVQAYFSL